MKKLSVNQKAIIRKLIRIILIILCIVSFLWLMIVYKQLYSEGDLRIEHNFKNHQIYSHQNQNINNIKIWMTFNYLNIIFRLDPNYLKNTFNISDPKYPNIRIDQYSRHQSINPFLFLYNIQKAITNYSNNK